jgi:sugar phosphate isomerase/epimerase
VTLACADFSFPLLSFDTALDLIAALEFDGVDLGFFARSSHLDPHETLAGGRASATALADRVHSRNLVVADLFITPGTGFEALAANHPDAAERGRSRDFYRRAVELAVQIDAGHLTALPGVLFAEESKQSSFDRCTEELAWRVEAAAAAGIPFGVEPHIGSIAATPADAQAIVEATPGLTLTLDYGHFISQGYPSEEIEPLTRLASHFHARCTCPGRLQCSAKENTVDFGHVVRKMAEQGYVGAIGVEYVWIDWQRCNEVDNLSETILLRDVIRQAMAAHDTL